MRIEPIKVLVGVGAGGVDELLEWLDSRGETPRTEPFKTWTDWGRIGLTLVGYLGQAFNFWPNLTAPLAQSETPLLVKSIGRAIREGAFGGAKATSGVTHARVYSEGARIRQTPGKGFESIRPLY